MSNGYASRFVTRATERIAKLRENWQGETADLELLCRGWKEEISKCAAQINKLVGKVSPETARDRRVSDSYASRLCAMYLKSCDLYIDHRFKLTKLATSDLWDEIDRCSERLLHSNANHTGAASPRDEEFYQDPDKEFPQSEREVIMATLACQLPWRENIETIKRICSGKRLLEVNAGSGLWGRLLAEAGVDITCTDDDPPAITYAPIAKMSWEEACVVTDQYDVLLIVWPPYKSDASLIELCKLFRTKDVIFIGELHGCTGSEALSEELSSWRNTEVEMTRPGGPRSIWWTRLDIYPVPPTDVVYDVGMLHWYPSWERYFCPKRYTK